MFFGVVIGLLKQTRSEFKGGLPERRHIFFASGTKRGGGDILLLSPSPLRSGAAKNMTERVFICND